MKKLFSIPVILLILLSGAHLSIATHFCGKVITGVKWSFSGQRATCAMEMDHQSCQVHKKGIDINCCHDQMTYYKVDPNYTPSFTQIQKITRPLIQLLYVPQSVACYNNVIFNPFCNNFGPPAPLNFNAVNMDRICVYRI